MDLDHIDTAIATGGGHTLTTISELVHAHGNQRAGEHVIASITQHLADADIHHLPLTLPSDGKRLVFLYRTDAEYATMATIALRIAEEANRGDPDVADAALRGLAQVMPVKTWRAADQHTE